HGRVDLTDAIDVRGISTRCSFEDLRSHYTKFSLTHRRYVDTQSTYPVIVPYIRSKIDRYVVVAPLDQRVKLSFCVIVIVEQPHHAVIEHHALDLLTLFSESIRTDHRLDLD